MDQFSADSIALRLLAEKATERLEAADLAAEQARRVDQARRVLKKVGAKG